MTKLFFIVIVSLLAGCRTNELLEYQGNNSLSANDAATAIDRALMTQTPKFRPESVDVTDEYVMYGMGTITRGRNSLLVTPVGNALAVAGGRSKSKSKELNERIYFDSLSSIRLIKGRYYIVQIDTNDRQPRKTFAIYNEQQAHGLIDGLRSLQYLQSQKTKSQ